MRPDETAPFYFFLLLPAEALKRDLIRYTPNIHKHSRPSLRECFFFLFRDEHLGELPPSRGDAFAVQRRKRELPVITQFIVLVY